MRKKIALGLAIFGICLSCIMAKANFPAGEGEIQLRLLAHAWAVGAKMPVQFTGEIPFPLPTLFLAGVPEKILLSPIWFRVPNIFLSVIILILFWLWTRKPGQILMLAITPWFIQSVFFDLPGLLTLCLVLLVLIWKSVAGKMFWLILLSLTSQVGLVFVAVYGVVLVCQERRKAIKAILILLLGIILGLGIKTVWPKLTPEISSETVSNEVDLRVRDEFKSNNYQDILPLKIKRMVYNKLFFMYRIGWRTLFQSVTLENLTFPGQSDATVTRGMWNSKGLSWIFFWQIILVILGIWHIKTKNNRQFSEVIILVTWAGIAMFLFDNDFLVNGIGLVPAMAIAAGWGINNIPKKLLIVVGIIAAMGIFTTYYHFITHELYWRDNRPEVQTQIAKMAIEYKALQATTILGRSFWYYVWLNKIPIDQVVAGLNNNMFGETKFEHFDFTGATPLKNGVYVGFQGEFLGNRKEKNSNQFSADELPKRFELLESWQTHDTVSFGNGDYIWAVKIN